MLVSFSGFSDDMEDELEGAGGMDEEGGRADGVPTMEDVK